MTEVILSTACAHGVWSVNSSGYQCITSGYLQASAPVLADKP